ncbi:MAG: acylneuraminate cytidylyltransferase family protein [Pseudolabrys sp.]|nr:acylneuraminate cytidylyltransferase family protein [Pseudolabrys sp.]
MKRICTICARGGSKGVPGKNLRPLLGKPLIAWSIEQAKASGIFDCVSVSSDAEDILSAAKAAGADHIIRRPPEMATDVASKLPAIRHALLETERIHGAKFETTVDIDVTSPLRLASDIVGAVELLETTGVASVITGAVARRSPYFNLVEVDAKGVVALSKPLPNRVERRQDGPRCYDMNASVYVWNRDAFIANLTVFYPDSRLFVMPEDRSIDIDSDIDFLIVEKLLLRRRELELQKED